MRLPFTKMHGLGNDFIVFEVATDAALPPPEVLRRLADRHTGIGFDQALALLPARTPDTDVFYRVFNSDGSQAEQCANGARCVASLVARKLGRSQVRLDSPGGRIAGELLHADATVSLDMGEPNFEPAALPFDAARVADIYPLHVGETQLQIGAVSMGNPHAVIQVPDVAAAAVDTLGPAVENHPRFARRTNVGFMEVIDPEHIRLRVYERGAGETRACGTGACAAVAVGRKLGLLREQVRVDAPGGQMTVRWPGPGRHLWLTGPAVGVYEGTVEI